MAEQNDKQYNIYKDQTDLTQKGLEDLKKDLGVDETNKTTTHKEVDEVLKIIEEKRDRVAGEIITISKESLAALKADIEDNNNATEKLEGHLDIDAEGRMTYTKNPSENSIVIDQLPSPINSEPTTPATREVVKKGGFGAMFDRLGTALGKLSEMIAGIMASIRGFESIQDESLMNSFIAKLSPEAQKSVKQMTTNSFMSFLGNKTEIIPILGAIKELTGDKKLNGEKMKNLGEIISPEIVEATSGTEVAEIIMKHRDSYVEKEETESNPEETAESADQKFAKTVMELKDKENKKLIEQILPTEIAGKEIPNSDPKRKFPEEKDKKTLQELPLSDIAQIQNIEPYKSEVPANQSVMTKLSTEIANYLSMMDANGDKKKIMGEKTLNTVLREIDPTIPEVPAGKNETLATKEPLNLRAEGNLLYNSGKIYQFEKGGGYPQGRWFEVVLSPDGSLKKSNFNSSHPSWKNLDASKDNVIKKDDATKIAANLKQMQYDRSNLSGGESWIYFTDDQVKDYLHPVKV